MFPEGNAISPLHDAQSHDGRGSRNVTHAPGAALHCAARPREAPNRLAAIEAAGNPHSAQRVVAGADHFFHDRDEELVEAVAEWLTDLHEDG